MTSNKIGNYWFLPSIGDVIFIIVFVFILTSKDNLLGDADIGYHIRAGEYIMDNFTVPAHDLFSYTTPPLMWTAHEWLSEVILALVHRAFGLTGLVVFMAFIIASVYAILLKFLRVSGVSIVVAACIVALAAGASIIHWHARPHIFSLMLTLIWYIILDTYQYRQKNYLYVLPPLMLLWVNLHGGFIAGLMFLAVYITGNFLKVFFRKGERRDASDRLKTLLLFFFLCLLASLLNPQGYKILLFPFKLATNRVIIDNVSEWLSPNFHESLRFEYMLLLMILIFGASMKRLNAIEAMLALIFTHMSLFSARYIPLYAVVLSPIIGKQVDRIIQEIKERKLIERVILISQRAANIDSRTKLHLWPVFTVAIVVIIGFTGKLGYSFDKKTMPVDAVNFIKREKIAGNVFNNDVFGSYIIYSAWPEYRVFFDGRSDMYGKERMKDYFKISRIETGWDEILKKYNINWIIFNTKSALSNFLLQRGDWKLIYSDKVANIFIKNTLENKSLINKYPDVKPVKVEEKDDKE